MITTRQPTEEGCGVTHKISVVVFTVGTVLRVASNHHTTVLLSCISSLAMQACTGPPTLASPRP